MMIIEFAEWLWWHWMLAGLAILAAAWAIRFVLGVVFAMAILSFIGIVFLVSIPFIGIAAAKEWVNGASKSLGKMAKRRAKG